MAVKLTGKIKLLCCISSQFVSEIEIQTYDGQMLPPPCFLKQMKDAFRVRKIRNKRHKSIKGLLAIFVFYWHVDLIVNKILIFQ